MKLILSRKGFDSSSGGCPNPIFPDGRMLALPIPDASSKIAYRDIHYANAQGEASESFGSLVQQLTNQKLKASHKAHLDPDLIKDSYPRHPDWQPVLGQHGAAQGHLKNQNVGEGDVFVFFALFREVECVRRRWQFVKSAPAKHAIWGWMFVESVRDVNALNQQENDWLAYHPHMQFDESNNMLYFASERQHGSLPGSGIFEEYSERLCLTAAESHKPSQWRLPSWFYPENKPALSYHTKAERWQKEKNACLLQAAARGQEFVLDLDYYPEAMAWLSSLHSESFGAANI